MTIIDRYLLRVILLNTAMVLFVLLALGGFIEFIAQLDGVGTGTFGINEAVVYVLLRLPMSAFNMLPIAALLGALMGLGALAGRSELVVMRAAGISLMRLALSTVLAGVALMIVMAALGELVGPPLVRYAEQYRTLHKKGHFGGDGEQSAWVKDGSLIINVQAPGVDEARGAIYVFELGEGHTLERVGRADSAHLEGGRWLLENYRETLPAHRPVEATREAFSARASGLNPDLLKLAIVEPDELAGRGLFNYIRYLRHNGLDARRYDLALWSRIASLVSVIIMTALALPFVSGPLRSAGAGARLMIGVLIGAGYFLVNKTLLNSSEVFDLDPLLIAWLPSLALAVVTLISLSRVR